MPIASRESALAPLVPAASTEVTQAILGLGYRALSEQASQPPPRHRFPRHRFLSTVYGDCVHALVKYVLSLMSK